MNSHRPPRAPDRATGRKGPQLACFSLAPALIAVALCPAARGQAPAALHAEGGGGLASWDTPCLSDAEEARIEAAVQSWAARRPATPWSSLASPLYTFFPLGARTYHDVFSRYFVDLEPSAGVLDWNCTQLTYDGHRGVDSILRSWGEQWIGVPIFAALDGIVIAADDGHPDMNTSCSGQLANYVVIDHGGGKHTRYLHMRNGSVAVSVGQGVVAGQQIGLAASSGCSSWPHLHFEERLNGATVDPFSGPCQPSPSGWTQQEPMNTALYLDDFGVSYISPAGVVPPDPLPRSGQWPQTGTHLYFWGTWKNMPAMSTRQIAIVRPDGVVAFTGTVVPFNNPSYNPYFWWWWDFTIPDMQVYAGEWRVRVTINGVQQIDAPVTVVPALVPGFNRPPEPISAAFRPSCPAPGDVVGCLVDADRALDDLDWDIVRYHYAWKVDGVVVRDVVSAGRADYLQRDVWLAGGVLTCEVTPSDGIADGPSVTARFPVLDAYCTAGTTSGGCVPSISGSGIPSASAGSGFTIAVSSVDGQRTGLVFYGIDDSGFAPLPWAPGSSSYRCVKNPVQRTPLQASGGTAGACDGILSLDWNAYVASHPGALGRPFVAPTPVFAQAWFRDPLAPMGTNLSDALEFVACP